MIPTRRSCLVWSCLTWWSLIQPSPTFGADGKKAIPDPEPGEFSRSSLSPPQLQFSCAGIFDRDEEQLAKLLEKGEPDEQLAAAKALWKGRSRRHAAEVLKFLAGPPPGGEPYRAFQREVEAALQPQAVLRELQKGDYLWGTWLAFLRPHKDLVPTLLAGLKDQPRMTAETILALGNSGDPRALKPLLELLKSKDDPTAGFAAQSLGYLGDPAAEPQLIESLKADSTWVQVNACAALATLGSRKAIPTLEKLAKNEGYTGAIDTKGAAQRAIAGIEKREKR